MCCRWLVCLSVLVGGCGLRVAAGPEPGAAPAPLPLEQQFSGRVLYKPLSECLFRQYLADRQPVDLSLFACDGRAVLAGRDGAGLSVRVAAVAEGSRVSVRSGDEAELRRIADYLRRCDPSH